MNIFQALSALLAVATCDPVPALVDVVEDTAGNYRYSFDSGDYIKQETRLEDGSTKGKFTFVDKDGAKHELEYSAGAEQGASFHGADVPVVGADTAENEEARQQHLAIHHAVESDPRFAESPEDEKEDPISPEEYIAAVREQLNPSAPFALKEDTPEIAAAKAELEAAHLTAVGH